nr:hypothetical protein [Streptomyces sp. NEAU-H3]
MLDAEPLGETDVVRVAVREDEALDVVGGPADLAQLALEVVPVPGEPGVHERDALGGVDEVRGDDVVAEAVEVRGELHGRTPVLMAKRFSFHG